MPLAYMSAIHVFNHVAYLETGQLILIYWGVRDVGLASICFAKAKGADVFAMVETTEQACFLVDEVAMPASHVISAHSLAGLRRAAQMTHNGGFDVIVSTAQGEISRLSLEVLAPLGHLIGLGQVDVQTAPAMSLESLQKKATYCSVDPFIILDLNPVLGEELMQAVDSYYRKEFIRPTQEVATPNFAQSFPTLGNSSNARCTHHSQNFPVHSSNTANKWASSASTNSFSCWIQDVTNVGTDANFYSSL